MAHLHLGSSRFASRLSLLALRLLAALGAAVNAGQAWSQTQADIDAAARQSEIIQRQQQDLLKQEQERAKRAAPPVGGADLRSLTPNTDLGPPTGACSQIDEIEIQGGDQLQSRVVEQISSQFAGRCLGVNEIEQILGLITKNYVERGYITTRAYLPAQNLQSRRLIILVVEGTIEEYRLEDEGAKRIFVPGAFPGAPGDKLNLRDLEQGIDQINRLTSNNAQMDIQPGSVPGRSVVIIRNRATLPLHVYVAYDNLGTRATGKQSASTSLTVDNPLHLNERWILTKRDSLSGGADHHSDNSSLDFWLPLGNFSFGANASRSNYLNMLQLASGNPLESRGWTETQSINLESLLYRDQSSRFSLITRLSAQQTYNYLARQRLATSSRNLSYADLGLTGNTLIAGGLLGGQIAYVKGLRLFNALRDPDSIDPDTPRAQFNKVTLDASYTRPFQVFDQALSWSSQFSGQYTSKPLYGSQQILIGSTTSVRGFMLNSISGDRGYFWRNELSLPFRFGAADEPIAGRFYIGYDIGHVRGLARGSSAGQLSGATIGFSTQWRGATWEFYNSHPVDQPARFERESAQTWFRVSYAI